MFNLHHYIAAQFRQLRLLSAGDNPVDDVPQLDALARGGGNACRLELG